MNEPTPSKYAASHGPQIALQGPDRGQLGPIERLVFAIESFPFDVIYRGAIGFGLVPAYLSALSASGLRDSSWKFILFFLGLLLALRVVPAVMRRALPFSRELRQRWVERRACAKAYDSYQWKKLLGIGMGLIAYLRESGTSRTDTLLIASICCLAGAAGWIAWLQAQSTRRRDAVSATAGRE
ncbi:MAG: hypothetical protein WCE48_00990 [Steroidobacteraceae bacterium]